MSQKHFLQDPNGIAFSPEFRSPGLPPIFDCCPSFDRLQNKIDMPLVSGYELIKSEILIFIIRVSTDNKFSIRIRVSMSTCIAFDPIPA
jgi:hypothetical protein